ncbi:hypothetical protein [Carnobacterium maltaromaticum]|uniref:hypothetical protein n=1 Tax=Carnobacterium maltaromaticum TaxID=2751 RepID=UPI00191B935A|nr:hypothetical protein [Carnobacterium maltaromaticum]CAD5900704.1 conserved exported hypothetical protein [Carnobacterium maltaromaticum]
MKNKIVLFLILLTVALSGCSKKIDIKDFEQPLDKDTSVEDLKEVNEIKENGYKMGDYVYTLGKLKDNDDYAQATISQIPRLKEIFKKLETRVDVNKKINIIPYSVYYDDEIEVYEINSLLFNTSKVDIKTGSYYAFPIFSLDPKKFEGITMKFEDLSPIIHPKEFVSITITVPLKKEESEIFKQSKPENVDIVIQDLIINGESVSNEN